MKARLMTTSIRTRRSSPSESEMGFDTELTQSTVPMKKALRKLLNQQHLRRANF